jgi:hypothetical protein
MRTMGSMDDRHAPTTGRDAEPAHRYSYSDKVLYVFVRDGRLVSIPAQQRKRRVVLRWLAVTDFREGERVPEQEVSARLARRHADVAALRRYLVEEGYLARDAGTYQRRPTPDWPVDPSDAGPLTVQEDRSPEE